MTNQDLVGTIADTNIRQRIVKCLQYIDTMEADRARTTNLYISREIEVTRQSFLSALMLLVTSERVWVDGPEGLSFGGVIGGIQYGIIERPMPVEDEQHGGSTPPIRWTFHS